jgi:malate synthase
MQEFPRMSATKPLTASSGIEILAPISAEFEEILTPEALAFVADLERQFRWTRRELLCARADRQEL